MPTQPNSPTPTINPHVAAFLARAGAFRSRIILGIDATASREPTWDMAAEHQARMFAAAQGIAAQLVYFRGDEFHASDWVDNAPSLAAIMRRVMCVAGLTQIGKVLSHAAKEHKLAPVSAITVISDDCEECPDDLYIQASNLNIPIFLFQEGDDMRVAEIYGRIARLTKGAVARFDASSARRLGDLLTAVAAFASGGIKLLSHQKSDAAALLLTQINR